MLADFVEVDAKFEKATEEFLHDELEYVVVKDWTQADRGIDLMRSDVDGRATFLIHPEPDDNFGTAPVAEPAIGPETGIVGRLSDYLRMTNGLTHAPAELLPRLARCYLAEDRQPPPSGSPCSIPTSTSCCPTASAITATRSAAAARRAADPWPEARVARGDFAVRRARDGPERTQESCSKVSKKRSPV